MSDSDDVDMFASSPTPSPQSVGFQSSLTLSLCTPSAPTDFESHPSDNSVTEPALQFCNLDDNQNRSSKIAVLELNF